MFDTSSTCFISNRSINFVTFRSTAKNILRPKDFKMRFSAMFGSISKKLLKFRSYARERVISVQQQHQQHNLLSCAFLQRKKGGYFSSDSKYEAIPGETNNQLEKTLFTKQEYQKMNLNSPDGFGVKALFCIALTFWMFGRRSKKVEALSGERILPRHLFVLKCSFCWFNDGYWSRLVSSVELF